MTVEQLPYVAEHYVGREQQAVTFEVQNPRSEFYDEPYDPEMMEDFFDASIWGVRTLGKDRNVIVGHLMHAIQQVEQDDDNEELIRLFHQLAGPHTADKIAQMFEL